MRRIEDRWTKRTLQLITRNDKRLRETANEIGPCVRCADGPAESSAGYSSRTSSSSLTKHENILHGNGEGMKRVEEMLGPALPVKTCHPSIQVLPQHFSQNISLQLPFVLRMKIDGTKKGTSTSNRKKVLNSQWYNVLHRLHSRLLDTVVQDQ
ncbi:hypothetical protein RB195_026339 [Necator americanus]|uniref:Uncharacterized protein n=1 Tax=Necator americanus TaxID=51031 RepID=A0ABR1EWZ7_NECAM